MKKWLPILFVCFATKIVAQDYRLEGNEVKIAKSVTFEPGTDKLTSEGAEALLLIKQYLTDKSYISLLRVECHIDNSMATAAGQLLTEKRALAVCKKLVALGIDCKRLVAVGFGDTKPVAANDSPEGKAQNRRVSFFNAALRGHLIGGMPADGGGKVAGDPCL